MITRAANPPGRRFTWNALLWALVFPQRGQRIRPTLSGTLLIVLSLGIGSAAYNSANNILFITLSLMLACLILSGVLSWLNFRGITWQMELAPPLRVGHEAVVGLALRNRKTFVPTYGLWFDFAARAVSQGPAAVAESTITGRDVDVRAALAQMDAAEARGQVALRERLDPRGAARLEWRFQPRRRGRLAVELAGLGSLFPFGFLKKTLSLGSREERVVWPAAVEYRRDAIAAERRDAGEDRLARAGSGGDLLALRRYASGDSHRLIHWKASARSQQLLVRQFAAESTEKFSLWLRTNAGVWSRPEQFELLVSFCATLAEDLFRAGQLGEVAIDDEPPAPVRRVRDLESFLDRLAVVQPQPEANAGGPPPGGSPAFFRGGGNRLTFAPDGARGVAAFVDGEQTASA
ncbi:MAG: hypothetical protein JWM88_704 [Verrucomicrobia bacterium]|nr:hypothetical protein [Verrucomicrobiota bacterium]